MLREKSHERGKNLNKGKPGARWARHYILSSPKRRGKEISVGSAPKRYTCLKEGGEDRKNLEIPLPLLGRPVLADLRDRGGGVMIRREETGLGGRLLKSRVEATAGSTFCGEESVTKRPCTEGSFTNDRTAHAKRAGKVEKIVWLGAA